MGTPNLRISNQKYTVGVYDDGPTKLTLKVRDTKQLKEGKDRFIHVKNFTYEQLPLKLKKHHKTIPDFIEFVKQNQSSQKISIVDSTLQIRYEDGVVKIPFQNQNEESKIFCVNQNQERQKNKEINNSIIAPLVALKALEQMKGKTVSPDDLIPLLNIIRKIQGHNGKEQKELFSKVSSIEEMILVLEVEFSEFQGKFMQPNFSKRKSIKNGDGASDQKLKECQKDLRKVEQKFKQSQERLFQSQSMLLTTQKELKISQENFSSVKLQFEEGRTKIKELQNKLSVHQQKINSSESKSKSEEEKTKSFQEREQTLRKQYEERVKGLENQLIEKQKKIIELETKFQVWKQSQQEYVLRDVWDCMKDTNNNSSVVEVKINFLSKETVLNRIRLMVENNKKLREKIQSKDKSFKEVEDLRQKLKDMEEALKKKNAVYNKQKSDFFIELNDTPTNGEDDDQQG